MLSSINEEVTEEEIIEEDEYVENNTLIESTIHEDIFFGDSINDNIQLVPSEYDDCYLASEDFESLNAPTITNWHDLSTKKYQCKIYN